MGKWLIVMAMSIGLLGGGIVSGALAADHNTSTMMSPEKKAVKEKSEKIKSEKMKSEKEKIKIDKEKKEKHEKKDKMKSGKKDKAPHAGKANPAGSKAADSALEHANGNARFNK